MTFRPTGKKVFIGVIICLLFVGLFACSMREEPVTVTAISVDIKSSYIMGETIPSDTAVTATLSDGTTKSVAFSALTISPAIDVNTEGYQSVTATYEGKETTLVFRFIRYATVSYAVNNSDYGSITGNTTQHIQSGTSTAAVTVSAAEGYYFVEWNDGSIQTSRTDTAGNADITYTATFQPIVYSVQFYSYNYNRNNFTLNSANVYSVDYGTDFRIPVIAQEEIEGYRFVGYAKTASKGGLKGGLITGDYVKEGDRYTPALKTVSLYPIYIPRTSTITFRDATADRVLFTAESVTYKSGYNLYAKCEELMTSVAINTAVYNYAWKIKVDESGENDLIITDSQNARLEIVDDTVVYIEYSYVDIPVSFQDGTTTLFSTTKKYADSFDIYSLVRELNTGVDYAPVGYTNLRWELSGNAYAEGDSYLIMSSLPVTFTLHKELCTYEIDYVNIANNESLFNTVVTYGAVASETKPSNPTHGALVFRGWYADAACTSEYDFTAKFISDTTIYAGWYVPLTFNFTNAYMNYYYTDRGTGMTAAGSLVAYYVYGSVPQPVNGRSDFYVNVGTADNIQLIRGYNDTNLQTTKVNYEFVSWCTDEALTTTFNMNLPVTQATTIYSNMEVERYTLNVYAEAGVLIVGCGFTHSYDEIVLEGQGTSTVIFRQCKDCQVVVLRANAAGEQVLRVAKTSGSGNAVKAIYYEEIGYSNTAAYLGTNGNANYIVNSNVTPTSTVATYEGVSRNKYEFTFNLTDSGNTANVNSTTKESYLYIASARRSINTTLTNAQNTYSIEMDGQPIDDSKYTDFGNGVVIINVLYGQGVKISVSPMEGHRLTQVRIGSSTTTIPAGSTQYEIDLGVVISAYTIYVYTTPLTYTVSKTDTGEGASQMRTISNGIVTDTADNVTTGVAYKSSKGFSLAVDESASTSVEFVGIKRDGEYVFNMGAVASEYQRDNTREGYVGYISNDYVIYVATDRRSATVIVNNIVSNLNIEFIYNKPSVVMAISITDGTIESLTVVNTAITEAEGDASYTVPSINYGSDVALTIAPTDGYEISSIMVNGEAVESLPDNLIDDVNIVVVCTPKKYTVSLSLSGQGAVTVQAPTSAVELPYVFEYGYTQGFSILVLPDTSKGYIIESVRINGVEQSNITSSGQTLTIAGVTAADDYTDYVIEVVFALRNQNMRVTVFNYSNVQMGGFVLNGNDLQSAGVGQQSTKDYDVKYSSTAILVARLNSGLYISYLKITIAGEVIINTTNRDDIANMFAQTYSFTNVKSNIEVEVGVSLDSYTFTFAALQNANITLQDQNGATMDKTASYLHGTTYRIVVTPTAHYGIENLAIKARGVTTNVTTFTYTYDANGVVDSITTPYMAMNGNTEVVMTMIFNTYAVSVTNNNFEGTSLSTLSDIMISGTAQTTMPTRVTALETLSFKVNFASAYEGKYRIIVYVNDVVVNGLVDDNGVVSVTINRASKIELSYERINLTVTVNVSGIGETNNTVTVQGAFFDKNGSSTGENSFSIIATSTMTMSVYAATRSNISIVFTNASGVTIGETVYYAGVTGERLINHAALTNLSENLIINVTFS